MSKISEILNRVIFRGSNGSLNGSSEDARYRDTALRGSTYTEVSRGRNGNGSSHSHYDSAVVIALRHKLHTGNGLDITRANKHHILRSTLGIQTCDVCPDLGSDETLNDFLRTGTLDQLGYLHSADFNQKKLPDESYLFVEDPKSKEKIYFESLNDDEKRLFLLERVFKNDYQAYIQAFIDRLSRTARIAFKDILLKELYGREEDRFSEAINLLKEEVAEGEQMAQNRVLHQMNGTYDWTMDFLNKYPQVAEKIYHYMRNGQRYFCRVLNDKAVLSETEKEKYTDDVLNLIVTWIKQSPRAFLRAYTAIEIIMEDIPIGSNRLSYELNKVQNKVKDLTGAGKKTTALLNGVQVDLKDSIGDTAIHSSSMNIENVIVYFEDKVAEIAHEVFDNEKRIIDGIKLISRRRALKKGGWYSLVGAGAIALLGTAGAYYNHVSSQRFDAEVSRISSNINPVIKIDYERIYNNALTEMGTEYPPEALDPVVISQYDLQMINYTDFKNSLSKKYCKILAAYLTPDLPQATIDGIQSGAIRDLPADLHTNFPHDLRNLFIKEEWYYPYDGPHEKDRICYGNMIGQGYTQKGVIQPGVLELPRAAGALVTFLHPMPFPSRTRPLKEDPVTHQRTYLNELIEPKSEKEFFGGVEPRDFIEYDFKLYVEPCNEMLRRIEVKKQEIINGFNESSEVQKANVLLSNLSKSNDLVTVEKQLSGLALTLKQKQEELEPVLKAIARCECRLNEIMVKLQDRFNTIKQRNSYRAIPAPAN